MSENRRNYSLAGSTLLCFQTVESRKPAIIDSLIGANSECEGNVKFSGGFHIDGKLIENLAAHESASLLTLSEGIVRGWDSCAQYRF